MYCPQVTNKLGTYSNTSNQNTVKSIVKSIQDKPKVYKPLIILVPRAGLEPARITAGDFESPVSTNSTTRAI